MGTSELLQDQAACKLIEELARFLLKTVSANWASPAPDLALSSACQATEGPLSKAQMAGLFGVTVRTIDTWVAEGRLEAGVRGRRGRQSWTLEAARHAQWRLRDLTQVEEMAAFILNAAVKRAYQHPLSTRTHATAPSSHDSPALLSAEPLTKAQVAGFFGVSMRALDLWIARGLLAPGEAAGRGRRRYWSTAAVRAAQERLRQRVRPAGGSTSKTRVEVRD